MKNIWKRFRARWRLAVIAIAGVLAFALLPVNGFKDVTQELIALFGLMMAGVLPTMVLTASVLRAGNLSVKKLKLYRDALRQQMTIWIGLFLISLISSLFVIIGKMLDWSLIVTIPLGWAGLAKGSFDFIRILNALITMALALITLRVIAVGNGIISLLSLSAELAISEAEAREQARHASVEKAITEMPEREGYGQYVELKH